MTKIIDLRSDTVTQPSDQMRDAILNSFTLLVKSKDKDLQKWELNVCGKENSKVDIIQSRQIVAFI